VTLDGSSAQSTQGPITINAPNSACVPVDGPSVNNWCSSVAFTFEGNNLISDDSLADVNWHSLLTLANESTGTFTSPIGVPVQGGLHDIFLRAPNAAVVVEGLINEVSVLDIPSVTPEPATFLLLGIGLGSIALARRLWATLH
jgi:hypothetical protein